MNKLKIGLAILALGLFISLAPSCGGVVYVQPAGTVSGNIWDVSKDYSSGGVEGLTITISFKDDTGAWVEYYGNNNWSADDNFDPKGCQATDASGNFTCDFVENGEYLITITDGNGFYYEVDYIVEVYFESDYSGSNGEYGQEVNIDNNLGVLETPTNSSGYESSKLVDMLRIVLTWGEAGDYDSYWSYPRADYHHLMADKTSPFYPDLLTGNVTTVPTFASLGLPTDYIDNSDPSQGPNEGGNKFQFTSDPNTVTMKETGNPAPGDAYDINAAAGLYGPNWTFGPTDPIGARGVMYWNFTGTYSVSDQATVPLPEHPYTYEFNDGTKDVIAVGLDRDSFDGTEGPETIFLGGIPGNNWYAADGTTGTTNEFNDPAGDWNGGNIAEFGDDKTVPAYQVGFGQYSVGFYSNTANAQFPTSRFDSSFATAKVSVSIYNKDGARMWTFTVPNGDTATGQNIPMRFWRPFYGIYQVEKVSGGNLLENIKFIPGGFDPWLRTRNNFDAVKTNLRERTAK